MPGINRYGYFSKKIVEERIQQRIPCIFLSHSSKDKAVVRLIAKYIKDHGIDVYFDENDRKLQSAVAKDNFEEIVECIQDGLKNSTHALCIMSNHTVESQWVPYEIGYSSSLGHPLALLPLAEVTSLPEFYRVAIVLETSADLEEYLTALAKGSVHISQSTPKSLEAYGLSSAVLPRFRRITYR